jgi:hypothetical protein
MKTIETKLKYVAKTGGIKTDATGEEWLNATKEYAEKVKTNLEKMKKYIGRTVSLDIEDDNTFSRIGVVQEQEEEQPELEEIHIKDENLLERKYIVNISGREFVTMAGLLDVAHKKGLKSIKTELVISEIEKSIYVFKTEVVLKNGSIFVSYGDANPNNVGTMIKPHVIRMAETRSIARALRWATNIGMTSLEELGDKEEKENENGS